MDDTLVNPDDPYGEDFLAHFGVKGMKWGVRRSKRQLGVSRKTASLQKDLKSFDKALSSGKSMSVRERRDLAGGRAGIAANLKRSRARDEAKAKAGGGAVKKLQGAQIKTAKKIVSTTVGGIKKLQRAQIATAKKELAIARAAGGAVKKLQGAQIKTAKKIGSTVVSGVKKLQGKQIATLKAEVRLAKTVVNAVQPAFQSAVKHLAVSGRPGQAATLKAQGREHTAGYLGSIGNQAVQAYATGIIVGSVAKSIVNVVRIVTP